MASRSLVPRQKQTFDIPLFLAPAFSDSCIPSRSRKSFSTTTLRLEPKNKKRGVSAIRSTGPRYRLSVSNFDLPVPVKDPKRRKAFRTIPDHGLWGFFGEDKRAMISPEDEAAHGRPWTYQELSVKDWTDLYKLYWTCILELNRSATRRMEMKRLHAGYGENECLDRMHVVETTMRTIRSVLRDRHNNHVEARHVLESSEDVEGLLADSGSSEEDYDEPIEEDNDPAMLESKDHTTHQQDFNSDLVGQPSTASPPPPPPPR